MKYDAEVLNLLNINIYFLNSQHTLLFFELILSKKLCKCQHRNHFTNDVTRSNVLIEFTNDFDFDVQQMYKLPPP